MTMILGAARTLPVVKPEQENLQKSVQFVVMLGIVIIQSVVKSEVEICQKHVRIVKQKPPENYMASIQENGFVANALVWHENIQ
ncbi:unnamed protein product [marine sediment metagenome]|uniref:Uncharacterized protein n=1 Tax=marine sediment metagenome TaxID=412755 RepID=X1B188_9ZZZZ